LTVNQVTLLADSRKATQDAVNDAAGSSDYDAEGNSKW
jgi:hypothetical protein